MIKKIISYLFLAFFTLVFIYSINKYIGQSDKNLESNYLVYTLISLIFLLLSIILLIYEKKEISNYVLLSFISIFLTFYLFEGFLVSKEILKKNKIYKDFFLETGNKFDDRFFTEVYFDLKKNNKNISTAAVTPNSFLNENKLDLLPLSGVSNSLTLNCNENGFYSFFQADRYGFNNPDNIWEINKIDYLFTGDSFVLGNCVNKPNDIASIFLNKKKNTLNLGYAGNGPMIQLASLIEYYPKNTKNIIWFFYEGNDISDLKKELNNKILLNYVKKINFSQNLKKKQNKINELVKSKTITRVADENSSYIQEQKFLFKFKKFLKLHDTRKIILNSYLFKKDNYEYELIFFDKIIKYAKNFAYKNNSNFYFVYLPELSRYKKSTKNNTYEKIISIINKNNINLIDIKSLVFDKEKHPENLFPFKSYGHYNEEGYLKVANKILEITIELKKNDK